MARTAAGADPYFELVYAKWDALWDRFGERPELDGVDLLEFGCGLGAFAVRAAQSGARVTGLDIDPSSIKEARLIHERRFPGLDLAFVGHPIDQLGAKFDIVLTNEVLEHLVDLPDALSGLRERLKPGGRLYAGWGPLWYAPTGGHQLTVRAGRVPIPWSHLVGPLARRQMHKHGWTFNYLRPAEYREIFAASGLEILSWRVNQGRHPSTGSLDRPPGSGQPPSHPTSTPCCGTPTDES